MGRYSGPRRDRPETVFSDYTLGLSALAAIGLLAGSFFLSVGIPEFFRPTGKLSQPRIYAALGVGWSLLLIGLYALRARLKEHEPVSALYVEFRDKQLRNTRVGDVVYFHAQDLVDTLVSDPQERASTLARICRGSGYREVEGIRFVSVAAIQRFLADRSDRTSILLLRLINNLHITEPSGE